MAACGSGAGKMGFGFESVSSLCRVRDSHSPAGPAGPCGGGPAAGQASAVVGTAGGGAVEGAGWGTAVLARLCTRRASDPRLGFACDPSLWWGGSEGQSLRICCLEGLTQLPAASGGSGLQERKEFSCQDLRTVRNLVPWLCMRSEQLVGMPPADNLFLTARLRASPRSDRLPRSRSLPGDQRTFRPVRPAHSAHCFRAR